jgi:hypothetical protein
LKFTDVSMEYTAYNFKVEEESKQARNKQSVSTSPVVYGTLMER